METGAKNARQGRTSFLLQHQKTVFCRRGPSDDRRQENHKEALDQAMTPRKVQRPAGEDRALHHCLRRRRPQAPCARDQRRFVAEFAGRAGEGTLVVWFSTGCRGLNFWRSSTRRTRRSSGSRIMQHRRVHCFSRVPMLLKFWAGGRCQGRADQACPGILFKGSFTGFALCGLAFPFWARSWRARTNISRGSRIKSRRFKSRLRRRYIPGCCKVTFYMFFL